MAPTSALATTAGLSVRAAGAEITVPENAEVEAFFTELATAAAELAPVSVSVEIPRDERRDPVVAGCAERGHRAKFRTGGVRAAHHPGETELAAALDAVTRTGVPFKATAGLHRAVRSTDPATGFEQHGFLNVLLATEAAAGGAAPADLARILAERDARELAARTARLADDASRTEDVRARFCSFGTCSIAEPLTELTRLGLVPAECAALTESGTTP